MPVYKCELCGNVHRTGDDCPKLSELAKNMSQSKPQPKRCNGCLQWGDAGCMIHSCVRHPPNAAGQGAAKPYPAPACSQSGLEDNR